MRTYTPKQIAEEMFAEVVMQQTEFILAAEARAEAERLRAENGQLREALKKIACRAPYVADDPWKIARDALKEDGQ